jgi:hypothetical protein
VQLNEVWYYDDASLALQQRQLQQQIFPGPFPTFGALAPPLTAVPSLLRNPAS